MAVGTFLPHAKTGADVATLCAGAQETVRTEKGRAQSVECGADGVVCGFGAWRFVRWQAGLGSPYSVSIKVYYYKVYVS